MLKDNLRLKGNYKLTLGENEVQAKYWDKQYHQQEIAKDYPPGAVICNVIELISMFL